MGKIDSGSQLRAVNSVRGSGKVDRLVERAWREARRAGSVAAEKVSMRVARMIVRQVRDQNLDPGTPLPSEVQMASSYNAGRSSIREALRILEVQGLITIKTGPGGGPSIIEPTTADTGKMLSLHMNMRGCTFGELGKARLEIDPILAFHAAQNASPTSIERMRDVVEMARLVSSSNNAEWARIASMFNSVIAAASGNSVLALVSGTLRAIYAERITSLTYTAKMRDDAISRYRAIIDAIEKRDCKAAQKNMFDLINNSLNQMVKRHPEILDDVVDWH